jgi:glycerol kinase
MAAEHVLAIDEGTTGVRALIVDAAGSVQSTAYRPVATTCPAPGLVEHDAETLWTATLEVIRAALSAAGLAPCDLAAVGVTTQRATAVLWDTRHGTPAGPVLSWQDQRTRRRCQELFEQGVWVSPLAAATKIEWLLGHAGHHGAAPTHLRAGTVDAWLVWRLSGGRHHVTDASSASCTGLYDLFTGRWDSATLAALGIAETLLPEIRPSSGVAGYTGLDVLGAEVPIAGIAGDQQASMFGQLCTTTGTIKATFGTSAMFDLHTGTRPAPPGPAIFPLVLWQLDGERSFCLEGSAITAGAAVEWLVHGLGIVERPEESAALAASVPDSGGVWVVPAFQGLGTPHACAGARAVIGGLTRASTRAHVARALLEGIAFRSREVFEAVLATAALPAPAVLRVDGGAARNDLLMQLVADVLGVPVERPRTLDAGALGAAYLAGRAVGLWSSDDERRRTWQLDRRFEPRWSADERAERWQHWRQAIEVTLQTAS